MKKQKPQNPRVLAVGNAVLIRTVTHYQTGRVTAIGDTWVVLEDAAWIASTGRFADALKTGTLDEVEPCSDPVEIGLGSIVDVYHWRHPLPREQK
jgi:hypothetical protein